MNVVLLAPTPPPHGGIAGWTKRMMQTNLKNGWKVVVVDEKVTGKRDAYSSSKRNYFDEVVKNSRKYSKENYTLSVHVNELERALGEM